MVLPRLVLLVLELFLEVVPLVVPHPEPELAQHPAEHQEQHPEREHQPQAQEHQYQVIYQLHHRSPEAASQLALGPLAEEPELQLLLRPASLPAAHQPRSERPLRSRFLVPVLVTGPVELLAWVRVPARAQVLARVPVELPVQAQVQVQVQAHRLAWQPYPLRA